MSGTNGDELQWLGGDRCGRVWLTRGQQADSEVAMKPRDRGQSICEHRGFRGVNEGMLAHSERWAVGKLGDSERASHSEYRVLTMIFGVCVQMCL